MILISDYQWITPLTTPLTLKWLFHVYFMTWYLITQFMAIHLNINLSLTNAKSDLNFSPFSIQNPNSVWKSVIFA